MDARWGRAIATPVVDGNLVFCSYPLGYKAFACDLSKLAANEPCRIWTYEKPATDIPTPVVVKEYLYLIEDKSKTLICLEAKTGTVQWSGQLDKSDMYYASITTGDDKLYLVNRKGVATIVAADPKEFRPLSTLTISDESPVDSCIAIADGRLYLRTPKNLYCFGKQ